MPQQPQIAEFPSKILAALDGSEESRLAARQAAAIARFGGAELHVVHVGLLSPWVQPDKLSTAQRRRLQAEAQQRLDGEVKALTDQGDITLTAAHLRLGRTDAEVIRLAEELGVGLIVVGNRGMGAISRIMLGSDAESIVRHAPCAVLVVRPLH